MNTNFQQVHLELDPNKVLFAPDNNEIIQYEEWKDIVGYENIYQVSSFGRVKSLFKLKVNKWKKPYPVKEKILKQHPDSCGYISVSITKNKIKKTKRIHRELALAFIEKPNDKEQVNHINEIKKCNMIWNLNWMTREENMNWGTAVDRRIKSSSISVSQYKNGNLIKVCGKVSDTKSKGFHPSSISRCCKNRVGYKSHKGFNWKYT